MIRRGVIVVNQMDLLLMSIEVGKAFAQRDSEESA